MMSKFLKIFILALVIALISLQPACTHRMSVAVLKRGASFTRAATSCRERRTANTLTGPR